MTRSKEELSSASLRFEALADSLDVDSVRVDNTSDLRAIAEAADAVKAAQALLNERVAIARARGRSWNRIAIPLGVSRQAARERFSRAEQAAVDEGDAGSSASDLMSALEASLEAMRVADRAGPEPKDAEPRGPDTGSPDDARPNLMELTPTEFEGLITNLFERMGFDTKQTHASRDGGVDSVAYDARPIFGGKVVIQAKRYKNTVGVSAVRDLFGTMQNEGATKGILVTTSGYGQASHEFANEKPIELIDGGNLLHLLQEHAGIEAKIEAPEDWVDPAGVV